MELTKNWKTFLLVVLVFASIALVITGAVFFKKSNMRLSHASIPPTNELKKVTFNTNGKITSAWLARELRIKRDADLFSLDISSMKERLEIISQIRSVFIEKRYPDTLFIKVNECLPILKFVANVDGEKKLFLVDGEDGRIFSPVCYGREDISDILSVNLILKTSKTKKFQFLPQAGMSTVKELILTLKDEFPNIFQLIKFLDLRNYDNRSGAIWSTIGLHLKNEIIVVLGSQNFRLQLMKLDYLLNEKCKNNLHRIRKITLSSSDDAVLEYK
ncbi:MAG: FtsQ-type POTRA domain-containing protein [Puniceicoccales bacterium]|jgi:cell division septal protein FtsQ|nr:FtsQ-type POTRA domain-containing protein [Puniceicoccales bacterium]